MIKNTITTMDFPTKFKKINQNGNKDNGEYSASLAVDMKKENINKITIRNNFIPTTVPTTIQTQTFTESQTDFTTTKLPSNPDDNIPTVLPPNPDDNATTSPSTETLTTNQINDSTKNKPILLLLFLFHLCFNL